MLTFTPLISLPKLSKLIKASSSAVQSWISWPWEKEESQASTDDF